MFNLKTMKTYRFKLFSLTVICCALVGFISTGADYANAEEINKTVTVEAVGLYFMSPECSIDDAHRAALMDARANALTQAHVVMDVRAKTLNMRLTEKTIRSYAAGYLIQSNIIRAGIDPDSEPPLYKVVIRAEIAPCSEFLPVQIGIGSHNRWRPRVALKFECGDGDDCDEYRRTLVEGLLRCGMVIAEPEDVTNRYPAIYLTVNINLSGDKSAEPGARASWTMSGDREPGAQMSADAGRVTGGSEISGTIDPESEWWQRIGILIAQDATRLWNTPRLTWVFVERGDEKTAKALKSIQGFRQVEYSGEGSELMGFLTIAGDPLSAITSALLASGVDGVEVVSASLFHVELIAKENPGDENAADE